MGDTESLDVCRYQHQYPKIRRKKKKKRKKITCHLSPVTCHLSPVTCRLPSVTCHLTTTLCSFTGYESPMLFGDADVVGLVIYRVTQKLKLFVAKQQNKDTVSSQFRTLRNTLCNQKCSFRIVPLRGHTNRQTDTQTSQLID